MHDKKNKTNYLNQIKSIQFRGIVNHHLKNPNYYKTPIYLYRFSSHLRKQGLAVHGELEFFHLHSSNPFCFYSPETLCLFLSRALCFFLWLEHQKTPPVFFSFLKTLCFSFQKPFCLSFQKPMPLISCWRKKQNLPYSSAQ